jgi:hypothetical protein
MLNRLRAAAQALAHSWRFHRLACVHTELLDMLNARLDIQHERITRAESDGDRRDAELLDLIRRVEALEDQARPVGQPWGPS